MRQGSELPWETSEGPAVRGAASFRGRDGGGRYFKNCSGQHSIVSSHD